MRTTQDTQDEVRNLLRLLEVSGGTRKQLADFTGKDPSTITERTKGGATISVPDLRAWADFFSIDVKVFFYTEEEFNEWLTLDVERALRQRVLIELSASVVSIHSGANRSGRHHKAPTKRGQKTASTTADESCGWIIDWPAVA